MAENDWRFKDPLASPEYVRRLQGGMEFIEILRGKDGLYPPPQGEGWELVSINDEERVACYERKVKEVPREPNFRIPFWKWSKRPEKI